MRPKSFNPRARRGRDAFLSVASRIAVLFQSTRPQGARLGPFHYLYKEYISDADKLASGMVKVLHFVLDDNPSLTREYKDFIKKAYTGVFYQRYILGKWVVAEGAIYKDCWSDAVLFNDSTGPHDIRISYAGRYIGVDYGTTNPCVFGEYLDDGTKLWKMKEYYWDSKKEGRQKTDSEYADDMQTFIGEDDNAIVILDPSAASFKAELRKRGIFVKDADNEVLDGIRLVSTMLNLGYLRVHEQCTKTIEEHQSYSWNEKRSEKGVEKPVKSNDHACDETRYVCKTMIKPWRLAIAA
jgi:PBSX family phage terminase large subunit